MKSKKESQEALKDLQKDYNKGKLDEEEIEVVEE
jgi:hypothetical protein